MPWLALTLLVGLMCSWGALSMAETPAEEPAEAAAQGQETPQNVFIELPPRDYSPAEIQLLQDLESQRIRLERRSQALALREKLVDLAEERLAQKVTTMETLQGNLTKLLKNASDMENTELEQLAKVYESMKPAAAAEIMNKMDNGVVYDVFRRMKNKSVAQVMEKLTLPKARFLTEMLAEETPLPSSGLAN